MSGCANAFGGAYCKCELLALAAARSAANSSLTAIKVDLVTSATTDATSVASFAVGGPLGARAGSGQGVEAATEPVAFSDDRLLQLGDQSC